MNDRQHDPSQQRDKKTIDLCGERQQTGGRCVRERGHTGKHECMSIGSGRWVSWE